MPVAPFAGDGHGYVMLPKVGSGVWIEFEAGKSGQSRSGAAPGGPWAAARPAGSCGVRVIVSEKGPSSWCWDDDANEVTVRRTAAVPRSSSPTDEITLTVGPCEIKISIGFVISLNNGLIKVGLAGVSLVNGAMAFGVPPS